MKLPTSILKINQFFEQNIPGLDGIIITQEGNIVMTSNLINIRFNVDTQGIKNPIFISNEDIKKLKKLCKNSDFQILSTGKVIVDDGEFYQLSENKINYPIEEIPENNGIELDTKIIFDLLKFFKDLNIERIKIQINKTKKFILIKNEVIQCLVKLK